MIDGKRLRTLRKNCRITANELGGFLGVSGPQITRYETGQNDMPTENLVKLSELFQVSADYLLGRADNPKPYEHRARPLTWSIDTTWLLKSFSPEFAARTVQSFGLHVLIEPKAVSVSQLLKEHSPEKVATFLRVLGLRDSVIDDSPLMAR